MRSVVLRLGPRDGDRMAIPDESICLRFAFVEVDVGGPDSGRPRRIDSPPVSYRPAQPPISIKDGVEVWLLCSD